MAAVPLVLKSTEQTAISKDISTETLINCFPTLRPGNAVSDVFLIGSHGYVAFGTGTAGAQVRGSISNEQGTVGFIVVDDDLYSVDTGGTRTLRGTIGTSSGLLRMVIGTTHLFLVDGIDGYSLKLSDYTFLTITDPLFPDSPNDVTFLGGYYIVSGQISGEYVVALSAIDDVSSWPVTNELYPADIAGVIKAVKAFNKELWIFGTTTTEVWVNTPGQGAGAFPLTQSYVHSWGLAASYSVAVLGTVGYMIARGRGVKAVLVKIQGSTIQEIENEDMNRLLQSFTTVSDAYAYCYEDAGQQFYEFTLPVVNQTWVYCIKTDHFFRKQLFNGDRFIANCYMFLNEKHIIGDRGSEKLYDMRLDLYTENGSNYVPRTIITPTMFQGNKWLQMNLVRVYLSTDSWSVNNTLTVSASRNGGATYATAQTDSIPNTREYGQYTGFSAGKRLTYKINFNAAEQFILMNFMANVRAVG